VHAQTFFRGVPGSTWIYKPLFNLRMLTDTLRYDTGEVENRLLGCKTMAMLY
jgi:hypothetical protein